MSKEKFIKVRVTEEEMQNYKDAALDQRYANFSQFVRDALDEKIKRFENDNN